MKCYKRQTALLARFIVPEAASVTDLPTLKPREPECRSNLLHTAAAMLTITIAVETLTLRFVMRSTNDVTLFMLVWSRVVITSVWGERSESN